MIPTCDHRWPYPAGWNRATDAERLEQWPDYCRPCPKCAQEGAGRLNPTYNEGDRVIFNLGGAQGEGIIRGLASKSVVDLWIVEMTSGNVDKATYPYSCLTVPHTCLVPTGR